MTPSEKLENPRRKTIRIPIINPYIHCPNLVFAPYTGSVATKNAPKRKDPAASVENNVGICSSPAALSIRVQIVPPKKQDRASLHDAAFL